MARLLIGLFCLLQGRLLMGIDSSTSEPGADHNDNACTLGSYCTASTADGSVVNTIPQNHGLCVQAGAEKQCWDACNMNHLPWDYGATLPLATQKALSMM